jgi:hypothetical protein
MTTVGSKGNDDIRVAKLRKHFENTIRSKKSPASKSQKLLFLESICAFADAASCMSKLSGTTGGIGILQDAMRCDLSDTFMNGHGEAILRYLSSPNLTTIADGQFLQPIIHALVEPPIFWNAFLQAFRAGKLSESAQAMMGWLLLQLSMLPAPQNDEYIDIAKEADIRDKLQTSPHDETRSFATQLYYVIDRKNIGAVTTLSTLLDGPGGRHDNDFSDIKDIAILPTADEVSSKDKPFVRTVQFLVDPEMENERASMQLDNQFRLLREDMLYELRDDLQLARGQKKGKYRGLIMQNLRLAGIYTGPPAPPNDPRARPRKVKWALIFEYPDDIQQLRKLEQNKRKKAIVENKNILRHLSLTCLLADDQIVAFPSIWRDEDMLAKSPPELLLQFDGCSTASVEKTLALIPSAKNIKVLQIDTAVFSYAPVLTSLQLKDSLPLSDELLCYSSTANLPSPPGIPTTLTQQIKSHAGRNLKDVIGTKTDITLDNAQHAALLSCLEQRVATIQGPPGMSIITRLILQLMVPQALESHSLARWRLSFSTIRRRRGYSWFAIQITPWTNF